MTQATANPGPGKRVGDYEIHLRGSGTQFKNPVLERFSHCHGLVPLFLYAPVVALCFVMMATDTTIAAATAVALTGAGIVFWTFFEYWMHREFFHWKRYPKMHHFIHGIHHVYPNDKGRMVMPPGASLAVAIPMWFLVLGIFGYENALPFYAGFVIGYVWYDETHFWTHVGKARSRWGKFLKKHHMMHHFHSHALRYGVSTPIWDKVFGTMPKVDPKDERTSL